MPTVTKITCSYDFVLHRNVYYKNQELGSACQKIQTKLKFIWYASAASQLSLVHWYSDECWNFVHPGQ